MGTVLKPMIIAQTLGFSKIETVFIYKDHRIIELERSLLFPFPFFL